LKKIKKPLLIAIFLFVALLISSLSNIVLAFRDGEKIRQKVVRLHIIANSDSEQDQSLKLKVRDEIISKTANLFSTVNNAGQAIEKARQNSKLIEKIANEEIIKNEFNYCAKVVIGNIYFPTREYNDNVVLPAGDYSAVRIIIGEGKGGNWWCVLFPNICVPSSIVRQKNMSDVLSDGALNLTKTPNSSKAKLRLKSVEFFNELYNKLREKLREIIK